MKKKKKWGKGFRSRIRRIIRESPPFVPSALAICALKSSANWIGPRPPLALLYFSSLIFLRFLKEGDFFVNSFFPSFLPALIVENDRRRAEQSALDVVDEDASSPGFPVSIQG